MRILNGNALATVSAWLGLVPLLVGCGSHSIRVVDAGVDTAQGAGGGATASGGSGGSFVETSDSLAPGTGGSGGNTATEAGGSGGNTATEAGGSGGISAPDAREPDGSSPPGGCVIGDTAFATGYVKPGNVCQVCDPRISVSAWSVRDGVACDDGLFCNGADSCLAGSCSVHAGNPCPSDMGNLCTASCDEIGKRCAGASLTNDCGTRTCGLAPSGCFTCGTCAEDQICSKGQCGCIPRVDAALAATPPPIPSGLKNFCLADPNQLNTAAECPVIDCGSVTYWAFSLLDNSDALTLVGYDPSGKVVKQVKLTGTRYIYKIEIDSTGQTATLIGQAGAKIVVPWTSLWP